MDSWRTWCMMRKVNKARGLLKNVLCHPKLIWNNLRQNLPPWVAPCLSKFWFRFQRRANFHDARPPAIADTSGVKRCRTSFARPRPLPPGRPIERVDSYTKRAHLWWTILRALNSRRSRAWDLDRTELAGDGVAIVSPL